MLKQPETILDALPEFTEEENNWCVGALAQPRMKPKRAAILFVHRFDRFLEIPVDKDDHPEIKDEYYPVDTVVYCVIKKFYYFRSDPNAANYKAIQAKKALYSKIYSDYMELSTVFDIFELLLVLEEMYLGIKEYDKNKLTILKEAEKMRVLLYQPPKAQVEGFESKGWHTPKAYRPDEKQREETKTELSDS